MPIAESALVAVVRAVTMAGVAPFCCTGAAPASAGVTSFRHLLAARPIAVPSMLSVPEVFVRTKIDVGSDQGCTVYIASASNPKTVYAASALIAVAFDAVGTAKVMTWTGPGKSFWLAPRG